MSQINLAGAKNAATDGVVFNELQVAQSALPTSVGVDMGGVHLQLGMNFNDDARAGWKEYVDSIYSSLIRFNNNKPLFSAGALASYLNFTFWADVALAEARRDIMMANFDDAMLLSAKTDFFGPGYSENVFLDKTTQIVKFNSIAAGYAANFAHPTFPVKDIMTYLVGNVFTDDNTARMNYIYFHCMNRSLHSTIPQPFQALSALEKMIDAYNNNVNWAQFKSDIHALILKVYGDAALIKAPIINLNDHIKYQYDVSLLGALRNAYYVPEFPTKFTDSIGDPHEVTEAEWVTPQDTAEKLINSEDSVNYLKGPFFLYQLDQNFGNVTIDVDALNTSLEKQNRIYTGKVFKGEGLCASLLFSQEVSVNVTESSGAYTTHASATSHCGITIAHMWCNAMSQTRYGTWNQYWIRPHILTLMATDGQLSYSIPSTMAAALRAFSQCNAFRAQLSAVVFGNFDVGTSTFHVFGIGSFALCDPIDEYAIYSNIRLYTTPYSRAYFKAGVDVYSPVNNLQTTDGSKPQGNSRKSRSGDKNSKDNAKDDSDKGGKK